MYSLAGAGLYGFNGVGPKVSLHLLKIYIVPILIYGLEALVLTRGDYQHLEKFYKTALRRIQHLPENTANPAIYLLLGCIPVEGQIHIRMLTFFVSIIRRPGSTECDIIKRQLAVKDLQSKSWVVQIRMLLRKYNLPNAYVLSASPPDKTPWKRQVTTMVNKFWMEELKERAREMTTLEFLDVDNCNPGQLSSVWMHNSDPMEAHKATVKVRLLVQRYPLGYSSYAGRNKKDTCALCSGSAETIEHFLLICPALSNSRQGYIRRLHELLLNNDIPATDETLIALILSPTRVVDGDVIPLAEKLSRQLVYKLHCTRAALMGSPQRYGVLKGHTKR